MTSPPVPLNAYVPTYFDNVDVLLYDSTYRFLQRISGWISGSFQNVLSDVGQWQLVTTATSNGTPEALAQSDGRVIIRVNGAEQFRGLLETDGDDKADENLSVRQVTLGGRSICGLLDRGQVRGVAGALSGPRAFTSKNIGQILDTLLSEAQTRGCFPELTWDFNTANDSAGQPWANTITMSFTAGASLLDTINTLVQAGYCDFTTNASVLRVYNPGAGLAVDNPDAILRPPREATQDPRQHDRTSLRNVLLVGGDSGTAVERVDLESAAKYGRREGFVSQSGVTDTAVLNKIGDTTLSLLSTPAEGYTYAWDATVHEALDPFAGSFKLGQYIRHDLVRAAGGVLAPLRVRSIAFAFDESNRLFSVELNDLLLDSEVAIQKQLAAIIGSATTVVGTPAAMVGAPPDGLARAVAAGVDSARGVRSIPAGDYAYVHVTYGPTLHAPPVATVSLGLKGAVAGTSVDDATTTGMKVYSSTWHPASGDAVDLHFQATPEEAPRD